MLPFFTWEINFSERYTRDTRTRDTRLVGRELVRCIVCTYKSVARETIIIPGRSSALLSKNGTSVGESDTRLACATRPKEMRIPRNPPILFSYLPARLPILPAILRVHPCRKRLCTDYKVDIGCTSCILYDLCRIVQMDQV